MTPGPRKPRVRLTWPTVVKMRRLREQRYSIAAIADILGVNRNSVHYHVRDIPPPPEGWHRGGAGKKGIPKAAEGGDDGER